LVARDRIELSNSERNSVEPSEKSKNTNTIMNVARCLRKRESSEQQSDYYCYVVVAISYNTT